VQNILGAENVGAAQIAQELGFANIWTDVLVFVAMAVFVVYSLLH
jgi:hypothetical protein